MWVVFIAIFLLPLVGADADADLVKNLPGLTFTPNFKTYSGYLTAGKKEWRMHYMLTESKSHPETDPLLVWFNGGPGCSSYAGLFEELGPFQINYDGQTVYENVYSWNAQANVLYLESPIGVGYSYMQGSDSYSTASDTQSLEQNFQALVDFFQRAHPRFKNSTFYLSGESYAGVYIPMLSKAIVEAINNNASFPNSNFQGAAIGNGFLNVKLLYNSIVAWSAYHGRVGPEQWDLIKTSCRDGNPGPTDNDLIDYTKHIVPLLNNGIDFQGDNSTCGRLIDPLIRMPDNMFPYNFFQDCYDQAYIEAAPIPPKPVHRRRVRRDSGFQGSQTINKNTAKLLNHISTDNQWGYNCWNENALQIYSNRRDVQKALNIDRDWQNQQNGKFQWTDCNMDIYNQYHNTYNDTTDFFKYVIDNVKIPNFRFLIYNGDIDTVCNYWGDALHMSKVAQNMRKMQYTDRNYWYFSNNNQTAGYQMRYSGKSGANTDMTIDVITVKGAGHMVPNDRPGPAVQMITNFLFPTKNGVDYSNQILDPNPKISETIFDKASSSLNAVCFVSFLIMLFIC